MSGTPLHPVIPLLGQRGQYVPVVGGFIQIQLHGEIVRAVVEELMSRDICTVRLIGPVGMLGSKSGHSHKSGDIVACQRVIDDLGMEIWAPIDKREVEMRENARRIARIEAEEREAKQIPPSAPVMAGNVVEVTDVIPGEQSRSTPMTRLTRRRRKAK